MGNLLQALDQVHTSKLNFKQTLETEYLSFKQIESEISDCLHILELLPLNASEIAKVTAHLRDLYKQRRQLKPAIDLFTKINNTTWKGNLPSSASIVETYSAKILKYTDEAQISFNKLFKDLKC